MALTREGPLRRADPAVAAELGRALDGREVSAAGGEALLGARGADAYLVGAVADELRRRARGDAVTYVVNRNINFTNVCVKQCGFCAFSRDFRGEEGYVLPVREVARRAAEAAALGATEVCVQAGLPPGMDGGLYEEVCRAVRAAAPGIHVHGFSPEEVLYGASRAGVGVPEFLRRLREAGAGTLPGTSAEILDQGVRDRISPGRISASDWVRVVRAAHREGLRTTATMMFGHVETARQRAEHLALLRSIQAETGGFTEFVPMALVREEAPMYDPAGPPMGAPAPDVLLTHAVSRIMLAGSIDNVQMSWVKEGPAMAQALLCWGANDFGGTLINESISTSAGAGHGQLIRPSAIRRLAAQVGRPAAQRDTLYRPARTDTRALEAAADGDFGSYAELARSREFRYAR